MSTCRVKSLKIGVLGLCLAIFSPIWAEEGNFSGSDEYFVGFTPLSPSVWNSYSEEVEPQSQLRDYLFREAYLVDANNQYLSQEGRMFTIPTDDLTTTQRRLLSPYAREEEETARRNYAETVTGVVVNKGVPEYMLQLLGLQKLREGVKKIERAVAIDFVVSETSPTSRRSKPWRFKTAFLPYQRSYRLILTNSVWSWDVQGGYTSSQGDMLFTTISARWGRFLQTNTYQFLTSTGFAGLSFFVTPNFSLSTTFKNEFKDDVNTPDQQVQSFGASYIF